MFQKALQLREQILRRIPPGSIVPAHTDEGHFYTITAVNDTVPSVTGKLQILKDRGLANYNMNRLADYVFEHWKEFTDANLMEHLEKGRKVGQENFEEAGDIGNEVHETRKKYFDKWIETQEQPANILDFLDPLQQDKRIISALRGFEKFVNEHGYTPIVCELYVYVYNKAYKIGGTLDDIGLIRIERNYSEGETVDPNRRACKHDLMANALNPSNGGCIKCGYSYRYQLVLLDLKTSNQFKDHYYLQVCCYKWMFGSLTRMRPKKVLIVKVSKDDGTYKLEEVRYTTRLTNYAKNILKINDGMDFIKQLRKPATIKL